MIRNTPTVFRTFMLEQGGSDCAPEAIEGSNAGNTATINSQRQQRNRRVSVSLCI